MTVIYEVTAVVTTVRARDFVEFMRARHIPEVLATGYFTSASFFRSSETRYCARYEAMDEETLDNYLTSAAPRLRADFLARFPEGVEVSREIWKKVEDFVPDQEASPDDY
jgi:hypothetical protein